MEKTSIAEANFPTNSVKKVYEVFFLEDDLERFPESRPALWVKLLNQIAQIRPITYSDLVVTGMASEGALFTESEFKAYLGGIDLHYYRNTRLAEENGYR